MHLFAVLLQTFVSILPMRGVCRFFFLIHQNDNKNNLYICFIRLYVYLHDFNDASAQINNLMTSSLWRHWVLSLSKNKTKQRLLKTFPRSIVYLYINLKIYNKILLSTLGVYRYVIFHNNVNSQKHILL